MVHVTSQIYPRVLDQEDCHFSRVKRYAVFIADPLIEMGYEPQLGMLLTSIRLLTIGVIQYHNLFQVNDMCNYGYE